MYFIMVRLMFVSAHPDDDLLVLGTFIKFKRLFNAKIKEVVVTPGSTANETTNLDEIIKIRSKEIKQLASRIGFEVTFLKPLEIDFSTGKVRELPIIMDLDKVGKSALSGLIKEIREFKPDIVITLPPYDYHPMHKEVSKLTIDAVRMASTSAWSEFLGEKHTTSLWFTDSLNLLENPTIYIDISDVFEEKIKAYKEIYSSQYDPKVANYMESLAKIRGYQIKVKYAEAFEIYKYLPLNLVKLFGKI